MANLLTDLSLTSSHDFTADTFEDITGMSATVDVVGTGSVVILMMSVTPTQAAGTGDSCVDLRFTEGGSQVGAILSAFADSDSPNQEINSATMMFALTGLSAGSHTFAVQGSTRKGEAIVDEARVRTFQIIEIETGASLLVDLETVAADASPATWANMASLSATETPGAGSVLIFNMTVQLDSESGDSANEFRFAVDGTRDGPHLTDKNDSVDEIDGVSMAWAADDISATSQTFSVQWQQLVGTPDMDETRERIFQIIEISADADLLVDAQSVTAAGAGATYTDQDDMTGSPDIDSTDSIALVLWNYNQNADAGAHSVAFVRLEVDGVQEGAENVVFKDGVDLTPGSLMVRAVTGESGVTDFAGQWIEDSGTVETDTAKPRTFQVIDLKAAAPDVEVALTGVEATPAVGTVDVEHDQALSGVEATPAVGDVAPSTTVDLSGVEAVTAVGDVTEDHPSTVEISGVEAVTAVGNVGVEESGQVDLAGVESPTAVGFVTPSTTVELSGVEATPEVGDVGVEHDQALSGVEATPEVGSVTPSTTVELSGVESVTAVGDVVAVVDAVVVLTGVESPSAVDSVGVEHDQALSGVEATPEVGSVTPSTTVEISGVETVSAVGSVTEDHPSTVEISGVEAVTAVGNVSVEEDGEVNLAGVESPSAVGDVGVEHDQALAGVEATPAVGSVTPSTTVELSGVESVTAVGDVAVEADAERALTGVESPSAVGSVGVLHDQDLSGVEATPEVGSVTPSTSVDLSGVEILPQVGDVAPSTTVELSGVEATPAVGTLFVAAAALGDVYNAAAFFPTGSTVTIEVWDPITGAPISLSNNGCNEVPGEGVFVWDSTKLTTQPTASYQEFLWKMTDGITEVGGVIRMSITVEDIFDRVGENGETFGESLVLIRANAAGSIEQDGAGSYKIKSADGLTDRIEGDPAVNDGRDITATDVT